MNATTSSTRRTFLATGGVLGMGLGGSLVALEEAPLEGEQPGDEVGAATRVARIQALRERLGNRPVVMLNLLKFKPGGEVSYERYGREFAAPMQKHAPETRVLFAGVFHELLIGQEEWDRILLVQYPSVDAFLAVTSSPEYQAISHFRTEALERSVLYALTPFAIAADA